MVFLSYSGLRGSETVTDGCSSISMQLSHGQISKYWAWLNINVIFFIDLLKNIGAILLISFFVPIAIFLLPFLLFFLFFGLYFSLSFFLFLLGCSLFSKFLKQLEDEWFFPPLSLKVFSDLNVTNYSPLGTPPRSKNGFIYPSVSRFGWLLSFFSFLCWFSY